MTSGDKEVKDETMQDTIYSNPTEPSCSIYNTLNNDNKEEGDVVNPMKDDQNVYSKLDRDEASEDKDNMYSVIPVQVCLLS